MKTLTISDIENVSAGKRNFFNVITAAVWGAAFGAILGIPAGPPGIIAGITTGALNGAGAAIAKEGAEGLIEIKNGTGF